MSEDDEFEGRLPAAAGGIFLDRDGTLIEDAHNLCDPAGVRILPGVPEALDRLQRAGYRLFLFSIQGGVGSSLFPLEAVQACNRRMLELLGRDDSLFDAVCLAPERPDQPSAYRKPSPRFILESIARHELAPRQSWMVGDKLSDAETGWNAGIRSALIGADFPSRPEQLPHYPTLLDFARALTD